MLAQNTILILGDSLSSGYGINQTQSWPALLQSYLQENHLPYQVVNVSITGSTTSNGLSSLPAALNQYKPKITIIELGGNDGLRGLQISLIKNNLQQMIDLAKHSGSSVLLLGLRLPPNYGPDYTQQFQQLYLDLAKNNNIAVVPQLLTSVDDNPTLMQADHIHPNTDAQPVIFKTVWAKLSKILQ